MLHARRALQKFRRPYLFRLMAYPAYTAYLSFPNGELWNDVRLVEVCRRKVEVHGIFAVLQLPAAAIATVIFPCGLSKTGLSDKSS